MVEQEVQEVLNKFLILEKMYKKIRFVDPVLKRNLVYESGLLIEEDGSNCFHFWGKSDSCTNCISMRSYNTNETHVKIEYSPSEVFMVLSIPIDLSSRRAVIELITDATNSMVVNVSSEENYFSIQSLIDRMNNLSSIDALTGVFNRRFMDERLPADIFNATLNDQNMSIIMTDIDFFKNINDTYGHVVGDQVLKSFAEILSINIKKFGGWISRYGGEEFLLVIPGTDLEGSKEIAEIIRKEVEMNQFLCNANSIQITSSFGVVSVKPDSELTVNGLIDAADKKLYLAKKNGRNRIEY